jgi:hypothetical protein
VTGRRNSKEEREEDFHVDWEYERRE